jgi:hypothetical protein
MYILLAFDSKYSTENGGKKKKPKQFKQLSVTVTEIRCHPVNVDYHEKTSFAILLTVLCIRRNLLFLACTEIA